MTIYGVSHLSYVDYERRGFLRYVNLKGIDLRHTDHTLRYFFISLLFVEQRIMIRVVKGIDKIREITL